MSQLVHHYNTAHKNVLGVELWVKDNRRFQEQERRLVKNQIFPKDYSVNILTYLRDWLSKRQWTAMPINVFCSEWALSVYLNEQLCSIPKSSQTTQNLAILVYQELMVVRMYLAGNEPFRAVVDSLEPLLGDDWLNAYKTNNRYAVIEEALEVLCFEYRVPSQPDYQQLKAIINL